MLRVLSAVGTRPEMVKMAPVVKAVQNDDRCESLLLFTAQHRGMLDQMAEFFGVKADMDLDVMREGQSLVELTSRLLPALDDALARLCPDVVLAQGDTTTVLCAAMACFYRNIPFGHVEAGLRTGDLRNPFPEEGNRRLVASLSAFHFAPTDDARLHLLAEGIPDFSIHVTGNTVIDALLETVARDLPLPIAIPESAPLLLVTLHRRESFGEPLNDILLAIGDLVRARPSLHVLYPVHPNPTVKTSAKALLGDLPNVHLVAPLEYGVFVTAMRRATVILTDSGGVQEEAPSLSTPVLVARTVTERPLGVQAGVARLVGTNRERIQTEVARLLDDPDERRKMRVGKNPYGDGRAALRIVEILCNHTW
ncbi:MAG: UDP-N-acetylglucosamine 2-epimerase (non-hydrolyzing) [Myxococcales bacterium]|nr:UDP-N-acetylglucosamine 2-epimerase (non-hydrolyzing) [Myxococcales bacterium]